MSDTWIPYQRNWLNYDQRMILIEYLSKVEMEISSRLIADPVRNEIGLTDELVYVLTHPENVGAWCYSNLHDAGLEIEITSRKFSPTEESKVGADVGMVLNIRTTSYKIEKALLLQAKRLKPINNTFSPESEYDELICKRGRSQAKKMLRLTPASFFILYNPSIAIAKLTRHFVGSTDQSGIRNMINDDMSMPFTTGNDSITVLPASTRVGLFCKGKIKTIHRFTVPFANFMVDDFLQCKVGDPSKKALQIARGENERNPVRYSLFINMYEAD